MRRLWSQSSDRMHRPIGGGFILTNQSRTCDRFVQWESATTVTSPRILIEGKSKQTSLRFNLSKFFKLGWFLGLCFDFLDRIVYLERPGFDSRRKISSGNRNSAEVWQFKIRLESFCTVCFFGHLLVLRPPTPTREGEGGSIPILRQSDGLKIAITFQ